MDKVIPEYIERNNINNSKQNLQKEILKGNCQYCPVIANNISSNIAYESPFLEPLFLEVQEYIFNQRLGMFISFVYV